MDERQETISLSVVVPLYDEGANVVRFYDRLKPVLDKIGRSHEILMIDDGSKDDTFARLGSSAAATRICGRSGSAATSARPPRWPPGSTTRAGTSS